MAHLLQQFYRDDKGCQVSMRGKWKSIFYILLVGMSTAASFKKTE